MNILINFAQWLDRKEFLRLRLWEFNLNNLNRYFPWYFLFRILLWHPKSAISGLLTYQKLIKNFPGGYLNGTSDLKNVLSRFSHNQEKLLIAPGFCMKPYDARRSKSLCPAGHFNHDCKMFNSKWLQKQRADWPKPCDSCNIGKLVKIGSGLLADFYIMTSAIDIARDLFLPALDQKIPRLGIFMICRYSTEAFTFGLSTSHITGNLVTFCAGDCLNHRDFTRADIGIKDSQTFIDLHIFTDLLAKLEINTNSNKNVVYHQAGNIYRPV